MKSKLILDFGPAYPQAIAAAIDHGRHGKLDALRQYTFQVASDHIGQFAEHSPVSGACDDNHDQCTDRVIQRVLAHGNAFFMGTTWNGRRAMRVSVLNWQTGREDIEVAIRSVATAIADEQAS